MEQQDGFAKGGVVPEIVTEVPEFRRPDGLKKCEGCKDRLVLAEEKFCRACIPFHEALEKKRLGLDRRDVFAQQVLRENCGVARYPCGLDDQLGVPFPAPNTYGMQVTRRDALIGTGVALVVIASFAWVAWHAAHDLVRVGIALSK